MRNRIILFATAILLAACADDQQTTAPASPRSARANHSAAGDVSVQGIKLPDARPTGGAAFTLFTVTSPTNSFAGGLSGVTASATATCPAGSQLVSGGYVLNGYTGQFTQDTDAPDGNNGWTVKGYLNSGNWWLTVTATAICIQ